MGNISAFWLKLRPALALPAASRLLFGLSFLASFVAALTFLLPFYNIQPRLQGNPLGGYAFNALGLSFDQASPVGALHTIDWDTVTEGFLQGVVLLVVAVAWLVLQSGFRFKLNSWLYLVMSLALLIIGGFWLTLADKFDLQAKWLLLVVALGLTVQLAWQGFRSQPTSLPKVMSLLGLSLLAFLTAFTVGRDGIQHAIILDGPLPGSGTIYNLFFDTGFLWFAGALFVAWLSVLAGFLVRRPEPGN